MREVVELELLSMAQMTPDEFAAYAIVVGVEVNPDPASPRRLMVPIEEVDSFETLRAEISRCAPNMRIGLNAASQRELETRMVLGILSLDLDSDGLCNRLPGGRPMVLARFEATSRFGRRAIAERAHRDQVVCACSRGEQVSEENLTYYRVSASPREPAHVA